MATLYTFCSQPGCTDGSHPYAGLIQASDGNLYGTTRDGGTNGYGTAFGITLGGQLTTLHSFTLTDGAYPDKGLLQANGNLYGTTRFGGTRLDGTVFGLPVGLEQFAETQPSFGKPGANIMIRQPDLTFATGIGLGGSAAANFFAHRPDLEGAASATLRGSAAVSAALSRRKLRPRELAAAATRSLKLRVPAGKANSSAQNLTTLLNFDGANGDFPLLTSLIQGTDGSFYGTTDGGGVYDQGTVFKVTAGGTLTTLYTFCSQINCTDGAAPQAGLVQATNGNFYGTTWDGGANNRGTVFEITPTGQFTTLYSFCSQAGCADGANPEAGLVQATNGNLYGTTYWGGANTYGTVFEITPAGQLTTLYSFDYVDDGAFPQAGLVQATDGNIYGTTSDGGAGGVAYGTVFEITPAGQLTTLYAFCQTDCSDGGEPYAGLVQAANGNLYGTTSYGGNSSSNGTVFEITLAGQLTTLYSFCSQTNCTDGSYSSAGLIQASDGNLYGTTVEGGTNGYGTVFGVTPAGQLTTLYAFGLTDGAFPEGGLLQANGNLYGTTSGGANRLDGTIFSLPLAQGLTLTGPTGTAQVGIAYSSALTATGGVPPYTFSITNGALPPGLSLNSSTGAITGTPTTTGTYNFTAQVADSNSNTATASFSIVVTSAGTTSTTTGLTLVPSFVPVGSVGPVVMRAAVTPVSGIGVPTGSVTYFNGSTQVGTATLNGGAGTFNYNPSSLAVGIYSITAVYSGDSLFSASTSSPQTLAVTQTGPFAYVANQGSNSVSVIDISSNASVATIPVGSSPHGVAISPDGTQVYVSNIQDNDVSVIATATNSVIATIPVQSSPHGLVFTPDGTSVYVSNSGSNTVSVIDTASRTVVATVPVQVGPDSVSMALTSIGTFAYVANYVSNTVSVIAVGPTPTVVATINVGTSPNSVRVSPNSSLAYVENGGSNNISVISVAKNAVTATIPVGTNPYGIAFSPDSSTAYVTNANSSTASVIDTASSSVVNTIAGFSTPESIALTMDGSAAYVTNQGANTVTVFATSTNTATGTIPVGTSPANIRIASNPPTELQITQPLSPTQPTVFNFGTSAYQVQYPAGTSFSNVSMTVKAVQITQAQFQRRVAGTQFANATCIVYAGAGGNCVDHQVTCSQNGSSITCPSETTPTISVQTSFSSPQAIIDPGYLTTPIGQNNWTNIFTGYADPTVKGKTTGFSEFVAVSLGTSNKQGIGSLTLQAPLRPSDPRAFDVGVKIPASFQLTSIANPSQPITDAVAGLTVMYVSDANGNPQSKVVTALKNAFRYNSEIGGYLHEINTAQYKPGTYTLAIYGNAFSAQQVQFTINPQLAVSPASINFGDVRVGHRVRKVVRLKNVGLVPLKIGAISFKVTEGRRNDFSLHRYCDGELGVGRSCTIAVKFFADAASTDTATLVIRTSARGGPEEVPITATVVNRR